MQQVSGVAAILRYPLPDLDELEELADAAEQSSQSGDDSDDDYDPIARAQEDLADMGL